MTSLKTARAAATATGLGRVARLGGGWVYTAAETAVVLYFGDAISQAITRRLDERAARRAVADSTTEAFRALPTGGRELHTALEGLNDRHTDLRNVFLAPLAKAEGLYYQRLMRAAARAKKLSDARSTALEHLGRTSAVRHSVVRRYGSVSAFVDALQGDEESEVEADLADAMAAFERSRAEAIAAAYPWRAASYAEEIATLKALRQAAGNDAARAAVNGLLAHVREVARRDRALFAETSAGAVGAVRRASR